jgi:hypothetical protein
MSILCPICKISQEHAFLPIGMGMVPQSSKGATILILELGITK